MEEVSEYWINRVTLKVQEIIVQSLSEAEADIRPSLAYKIIGHELQQRGNALAKSVERNKSMEN
jgi:hypothetical protein